MNAKRLLSRVILPLAVLALTAGILSCAPVQAGPRVWIDWPREGHRMEAGTTLTIICHAYAREGVAEVQLAVNGAAYLLDTPAAAGEQFIELSLEWVPSEPGDYLLSVTAFDMTGEPSLPASVSVTVPGEAATPVLTPTEIAPTAPAGETPPPPTETPLPPTPTPPPSTGTPQPPTATPPPPLPTIVSFTANPPSVGAGQCTTLSWAVEGVISSVWLDGEGVGDHDSRQRCPDAATSYTLRAQGPGGEVTASVTVQVTQPSPPPDNQGPPAPALVSPTGGVMLDCEPVTLDWNPVSDPSGIGTYYVKWEREVTPGNWQSLGGQATTGTQVTISLDCGISYRWSVMAEDGAGNPGPWAGWAEFGVTFG